MLMIRLVFMLLMVAAIACVAAYMATGQVVWRQRGLLIVKWTVLAGLAGAVVLLLERLTLAL
jgi:hypothetical protein